METELRETDIREACLDDLEIIYQLTLKLHIHEDDGSIKTHDHFETNLKSWLKVEFNNPRTLFLIAENLIDEGLIDEGNNRIIGFISATSIINDNGFLASPIKGVIQLLWVEPEFRQHSIAKNLVYNVEQCFKEIGIKYVECSYTSFNNQAKAFWSKLGYLNNSITARKFITEPI